MNDLERLKEMLVAMPSQEITKLAAKTNVSISGIYKIRNGETSNPGFGMVQKLLAGIDSKVKS